mgnify:CR=1 FL=1
MTPFSAWSSAGAIPTHRGWSEQALLSLLWGDHASPLETRWASLFRDLTKLGPQHIVASNQVGALGIYAPMSWLHGDRNGGRIGTTGVDIDLDFQRIGAAFATGAPRSGVLPASVRLFDKYGDALLTLAQGPHVDPAAFRDFVARHTRLAPSPLPTVAHPEGTSPVDRPSITTLDAALEAWSDLADRRGLEDILTSHGVNREELYTAAENDVASPIAPRDIVELLRWMVSQKAPMAFQVGRTGVVVVARVIPDEVAVTAHGVELCGSAAVLRLDPRRLNNAWLVKTETESGVQRSIEFLDEAGELAVCLGGAEQSVAAGVSGWTRQPFRPGA